eukprot:1923798-Prymnesium_polylepis.1
MPSTSTFWSATPATAPKISVSSAACNRTGVAPMTRSRSRARSCKKLGCERKSFGRSPSVGFCPNERRTTPSVSLSSLPAFSLS